MKALAAIVGVISLFVSLPISFYLQWHVYQMIHATDVMWLLFWVQFPVLIVMQAISKIVEIESR